MNPFGAVNAWADRLEKSLPRWLQYDYVGDPVSWYFSHPAFTLGAAMIGAGLGVPLGLGALGAQVGAWTAVACYLIREGIEARARYRRDGWPGAWKRLHRNPYPRPEAVQVGWLADAIGDVAGPTLVAALITWAL